MRAKTLGKRDCQQKRQELDSGVIWNKGKEGGYVLRGSPESAGAFSAFQNITNEISALKILFTGKKYSKIICPRLFSVLVIFT